MDAEAEKSNPSAVPVSEVPRAMRARPRASATTTDPRRRAPADRRPHERPRPEEAATPELTDERRWREAGGPEDQATYSCRCGAVFSAPVSTSVDCPLCHTQQAW